MINFEIEIEKIKEQIINKYKPDKIILFGSCALNKQQEYSDIDIFIIKSSDKRFIDRTYELLCMLDYDVPLDVVIYTPTEFEEALKDSSTFANEIANKGVVLYERAS